MTIIGDNKHSPLGERSDAYRELSGAEREALSAMWTTILGIARRLSRKNDTGLAADHERAGHGGNQSYDRGLCHQVDAASVRG